MVYINTLIIQEVLSDPAWANKLTPEDKRALSPLIHAHINPYGLFPLDLYQHLLIEISKYKDMPHDESRTHALRRQIRRIVFNAIAISVAADLAFLLHSFIAV